MGHMLRTTSQVPEAWEFVGRGKDPETDLPMVMVARQKYDGQHDRMTIWKLVQRTNGWYSVGQFISKGVYRKFPETNGVKLSNSRIDQILLSFATKGYA